MDFMRRNKTGEQLGCEVANVIDGEFNHVFPQYSSPIKMVGHQDGEKWSSVHRISPPCKEWQHPARRTQLETVRRLTCSSFAMYTQCLERVAYGTFVSLHELPFRIWLNAQVREHHHFSFPYIHFAFCVRQPKPLRTEWLMIILMYISICPSVELIRRECVAQVCKPANAFYWSTECSYKKMWAFFFLEYN